MSVGAVLMVLIFRVPAERLTFIVNGTHAAAISRELDELILVFPAWFPALDVMLMLGNIKTSPWGGGAATTLAIRIVNPSRIHS